MIHIAKRASGILLLTGIALFMAIESVYAQRLPDEKEVNLSFAEVRLDSALYLLSESSRVNISYDADIIPQRTVSLNAHWLKLGLALDNILVNTDLRYKIVGNQLVIVPRQAQSRPARYKLSGYILDDDSGEALVYATVYTDEATFGITTNDYGYYSLEVPAGLYAVHFAYLGYRTESLELNLMADTVMTVRLKTDNVLEEVVIVDQQIYKNVNTENSVDAALEQLSAAPSLAGEPDLLRMMQLHAGISSGPDGLGGLSVRGSSPDQNLVLFDGVPVYQSGHAFGLFSIFNPSMIKSSRLIKSAFPARYGGRVGSVLEVFTKEGNNQELHGEAAISPLSLRAILEGPIQKDKSSFIVSARRTIIDPWLKPLSAYEFERKGEEGYLNFYFYDLNAKLNVKAGNMDQFYLSAYMGQDRYANESLGRIELNGESIIEELDETRLKWGNKIAVFRWNHVYGSKLFSNFNLSYSRYQFQDFDFKRNIFNPDIPQAVVGFTASLFDSDIEDQLAALDFDYFINRNWNMHFGLSAIRHRFTPGTDLALTSNTQLGEDLRLDADRIKSQKQFSSYTGHELRSYLENQWIFGTTLVINAGAHFSRIGVGGQNYQYIEPRLAARINFSDKAFIGFAYSEMDQYMHLLSTSGLGLPNDVWIPATSQIKPQYARHLSIQLQWELLPSVRMDLSAFDRNTDRIRSLREGAVFNIQEGYDWQENLPTGESKSRGVELSMERREGNPRFWANYSWTKTEDLFETLNSGLAFRSRNDRRHMANTGMIIAVNQNLEFSFAWTYRSGTPITLPVFFQPVPIDNGIEIIPKYGPIHNAELPQYHRLDVGVNLYNDYSWGKQKLSIGAYNAYARSNPFYVDIVRDIKDPSTLQLEQVSLFPFVPYVNFSLTF